jgi:hypothetical protein
VWPNAIGATILAVSTLIAAGCVPVQRPLVPPGARACVGVPNAQCEDLFRQADETAQQRGTVVAGVIVRCTAICTGAGGEAEVSISFGDGSSQQSGFGWQVAAPVPAAGTPRPAPSLPVVPTCAGLDATTCDARALESISDVEPDLEQVVSIVVRCTPGPCTPAEGEGETTITFVDGQTKTISWGYSSSP